MRKFGMTTAAALLALASVAAPMSAAACPGWNTDNFHLAEGPERIAQCLREGMDPNVNIIFGKRPLHVAAKRGKPDAPEIIRLLLKHGAEPNAAESGGDTPLHVAAGSIPWVARGKRVAALLAGGADPNRRNDSGDTPLHVAARRADGEAVAALLKGGADPKSVNNNGSTPLSSFIKRGPDRPEIITRLIRGGADPNYQGPGGKTPLHVLAAQGGTESTKIARAEALLAGGTNPCIRDDTGSIPAHYAEAGGDLRDNVLYKAGGHDDACEKRKGRPTVRGSGSGGDSVRAEVMRNKCEGKERGAVCWEEMGNRPGCYWLNDFYNPAWTGTWPGACRGGVAEGEGTLARTHTSSGRSVKLTGTLRAGKLHGTWVFRFPSGKVQEGPFVDGKRNGQWVFRFADGAVHEGPYVDDKRNGQWVFRSASGRVSKHNYVNGQMQLRHR